MSSQERKRKRQRGGKQDEGSQQQVVELDLRRYGITKEIRIILTRCDRKVGAHLNKSFSSRASEPTASGSVKTAKVSRNKPHSHLSKDVYSNKVNPSRKVQESSDTESSDNDLDQDSVADEEIEELIQDIERSSVVGMANQGTNDVHGTPRSSQADLSRTSSILQETPKRRSFQTRNSFMAPSSATQNGSVHNHSQNGVGRVLGEDTNRDENEPELQLRVNNENVSKLAIGFPWWTSVNQPDLSTSDPLWYLSILWNSQVLPEMQSHFDFEGKFLTSWNIVNLMTQYITEYGSGFSGLNYMNWRKPFILIDIITDSITSGCRSSFANKGSKETYSYLRVQQKICSNTPNPTIWDLVIHPNCADIATEMVRQFKSGVKTSVILWGCPQVDLPSDGGNIAGEIHLRPTFKENEVLSVLIYHHEIMTKVRATPIIEKLAGKSELWPHIQNPELGYFKDYVVELEHEEDEVSRLAVLVRRLYPDTGRNLNKYPLQAVKVSDIFPIFSSSEDEADEEEDVDVNASRTGNNDTQAEHEWENEIDEEIDRVFHAATPPITQREISGNYGNDIHSSKKSKQILIQNGNSGTVEEYNFTSGNCGNIEMPQANGGFVISETQEGYLYTQEMMVNDNEVIVIPSSPTDSFVTCDDGIDNTSGEDASRSPRKHRMGATTATAQQRSPIKIFTKKGVDPKKQAQSSNNYTFSDLINEL